jgi:long-chain fatty acid transport protein
VKYYDWEGAAGYGEFDWSDQFVFALGAQYMATSDLVLRAGFNYGENPVNPHNGFDPMGVTQIQGKSVPTFGYEMLRTVGFPAIVESHLTLGFGYKITEALAMNLDYMHAFEKTFSESSMGNAINLESSLEENAIGFSLAWQFE